MREESRRVPVFLCVKDKYHFIFHFIFHTNRQGELTETLVECVISFHLASVSAGNNRNNDNGVHLSCAHCRPERSHMLHTNLKTIFLYTCRAQSHNCNLHNYMKPKNKTKVKAMNSNHFNIRDTGLYTHTHARTHARTERILKNGLVLKDYWVQQRLRSCESELQMRGPK